MSSLIIGVLARAGYHSITPDFLATPLCLVISVSVSVSVGASVSLLSLSHHSHLLADSSLISALRRVKTGDHNFMIIIRY